MHLEDMIIAHAYLTELGEEKINHLLDLMEDPSRPTPASTLVALRRFLKSLEEELGEEHPAVQQVRKALALPPRWSVAGVSKNTRNRIC